MPLVEGARYTFKPRVATPSPIDIPRWETEPDDQTLFDLYDSMATPLQAAEIGQRAPVVNTGFGNLGLKSLDQWRQDSIYNQALKDAEAQQAQQVQQTNAFRTEAADSLKSFVGKSMGASSYGARITGLPEQRGSAPMGFQPAMWNALQGIFSEMEKAGVGRPGITDGWRSYDAQVALKKKKPKLAATPGRSVHGLGYAADLDLTPAQQRFMEARGAKYGLGRLSNEPWHWQLSPAKRG